MPAGASFTMVYPGLARVLMTSGDFAVTHSGGKTMFSFQYPSVARIDFRDMKKELGPNEKCHCGSGKKFKKCHGMLVARPPSIPY